MRYSFDSDLNWNNGVSKHHQVELDAGFYITEFLRGRDIAATLATHQGVLRKEIQRIVIEEILPKVFSGVGAIPVEGELNTHARSQVESSAKLIERRTPHGADVEIRGRLSVILNIDTDRPVTALQALHGSTIAVADAITNDIMNHLAHRYFGITDHHTNTHSSVKNGNLKDHEAKYKGNFPNQN